MTGWTVVVWAVVAPDLKDAFAADLREAKTAIEAGRGQDVHVHLVATGPGAPDQRMWSSPAPADAEFAPTLKEVLEHAECWTVGDRKRLLVLWGHGAGAFPALKPVPDVLTAGRVVEAFAGDPLGAKPPHIIGYDACQMATVATVLDLAQGFSASMLAQDFTESMLAQGLSQLMFVGSMMPEPASGWPYVELLRILGEDWPPEATAAAIVEAYAASVDVDDWCLLAMDLAKVAADDGLDDKLALLKDSPKPGQLDFFVAAHGADILVDTNTVDLGALMRRLGQQESSEQDSSEQERREAARAVGAALRDATVARRAAGALSGRDGLAIQVETPWDRTEQHPWPDDPDWTYYLPGPAPSQT
jgi:hypothetical protein